MWHHLDPNMCKEMGPRIPKYDNKQHTCNQTSSKIFETVSINGKSLFYYISFGFTKIISVFRFTSYHNLITNDISLYTNGFVQFDYNYIEYIDSTSASWQVTISNIITIKKDKSQNGTSFWMDNVSEEIDWFLLVYFSFFFVVSVNLNNYAFNCAHILAQNSRNVLMVGVVILHWIYLWVIVHYFVKYAVQPFTLHNILFIRTAVPEYYATLTKNVHEGYCFYVFSYYNKYV